MTDETDYYRQGQKDCRSYYRGQAFGSLSRMARPEDIMKIFWPPENEMMSQMATPLPKPRAKWLQGFKKEQIIIKAEEDIKCLHCGTVYTDKEEQINDKT